MTLACLIVAAGSGNRLPGETPKQYRLLGGVPVLTRTIRAVLAEPAIAHVLCVTDPGHQDLYDQASAPIRDPRLLPPVAGGATRQDSVRRGLEALAAHAPDSVLIHDAARPFVSPALISGVIAGLQQSAAVLPALPVTDTLWSTRAADLHLQDREGLWRAQTPQGFAYAAILAAHRSAAPGAPDDIAVARAAGMAVEIVEGSEDNLKLTFPGDLARAERSFGMDIRTGNGFDVHRFGPGTSVVLGGVVIPFSKGLEGHSDADVVLHAVTDAVFGALAEGDIGQWFPPSDPQWKGAASEVFLAKAAERAQLAGARITHIDCTVLCEAPRIAPHAEAMRGNIARICGLGSDRVSIKATTTEKLGFTGRGEGIAAMATATLLWA